MGKEREIELSIIIVNWYSADYVRSCVGSIVAETKRVNYEIIVVDNASFDPCGQVMSRYYPDVVFLESDRNLGFGGANNLGADQARGRDLLFLNPDTNVRVGAIDRLHAQFERIVDAGVVGCRLLNSDGSLQISCVQAFPTVLNQVLDADLLRRLTPRAKLWGTRALFGDSAEPLEVEAVSGACMMVQRELFKRVGGFSPKFFMYGEDLDLCARVRRAGFRNAYVGSCEIVHHGGGSAGNVQSTFSAVMMCESIGLLLRRSRGPVSSISYRVCLTVAGCVRLIILAATAPAWVMAFGATSWRRAFRKWLAVVAWGLGLKRAAQPRLATLPL
jgi:GT2 family glycosyltransferase